MVDPFGSTQWTSCPMRSSVLIAIVKGVRRLEITMTKQIKKTGTSLCIMITRDLKELLQLKEGDLVEIRMRKIEDTTEGVSSGKDAILH